MEASQCFVGMRSEKQTDPEIMSVGGRRKQRKRNERSLSRYSALFLKKNLTPSSAVV
jgi:hypothetical protein